MLSFLLILCISFSQKSTVQTARTNQKKTSPKHPQIPPPKKKNHQKSIVKSHPTLPKKTTEIQPVEFHQTIHQVGFPNRAYRVGKLPEPFSPTRASLEKSVLKDARFCWIPTLLKYWNIFAYIWINLWEAENKFEEILNVFGIKETFFHSLFTIWTPTKTQRSVDNWDSSWGWISNYELPGNNDFTWLMHWIERFWNRNQSIGKSHFLERAIVVFFVDRGI